MKKLTCFFAVLFAGASLFAGSIFIDGTYAGDSRYNVKKVFGGIDDDLCWAASASNLLQIWQDSLTGAGTDLPTGTPNGKTQPTYQTDIFATFVNNWTNGGSLTHKGIIWWLDGTYTPDPFDPEDPESEPTPGTGGYYSPWGLVGSNHTWMIDYEQETSSDKFKMDMDEVLANGWYMALGIGSEGGGHAITLWGYEFDDLTGDLTGIWITDSDNDVMANFLVPVVWDDEDFSWDLGDAGLDDYTGWSIEDLFVFTGAMPVPEPAAFAFLAAGILLCFTISRRRKKHSNN